MLRHIRSQHRNDPNTQVVEGVSFKEPIHIGGNLYIESTYNNDQLCVDIREWASTQDGNFTKTSRGITLTLAGWKKLLDVSELFSGNISLMKRGQTVFVSYLVEKGTSINITSPVQMVKIRKTDSDALPICLNFYEWENLITCGQQQL